jgi:hypothetical protein
MIKRIFCVSKMKMLNKRETENKIKMRRTTQDGKVREETDTRGMLMEGCRQLGKSLP